MYGPNSSELRELQGAYNFGNENPSVVRRGSDSTPVHNDMPNAVFLQDVDLDDDEDQAGSVFSPSESVHVGRAPQGMFGPMDSLTEGEKSGHSETKKKREGTAAYAAKEVFGKTKFTKGMSKEQKAQAHLEQRWKNALQEEQRLNELEGRLASQELHSARLEHQPNFPPKLLCIKPLVYHNLEEVPEERRFFVKSALWDWAALSICLVLNMIVCIGVGCAPYREGVDHERFNGGLNVTLSVVYLVGIPTSFIIWYWPMYSACSTGRPSKHVGALFGLLIALAQALFAFVGPKNYGVAGLDFALHISRTRPRWLVSFVIVVALLWLAQAVALTYFIVRQFMFYRLDLQARREARRAAPHVIGVKA